jgi:hypothetical protein
MPVDPNPPVVFLKSGRSRSDTGDTTSLRAFNDVHSPRTVAKGDRATEKAKHKITEEMLLYLELFLSL